MSMALKARNDLHLARRFWHFVGVMSMVALYWFLTPETAVWVALGVSSFMISFDLARLYVPYLNVFFTWLFRPFLRESERQSVAGSTFMMAGVTLIIWLFPKNVVLLTLTFFAVADPLASYCGIRFGKDRLIGKKTLQGTLAAFAACFLLAIGFGLVMDSMRERLFLFSLLAGLIGALAELIPIGKLDDNLVFPILSATGLTGLFYVFGGF
jgi:diacylglycerol kinase (CTP)